MLNDFDIYSKPLSSLPEGRLLINTINAHSYNTTQTDAAFAQALAQSDVLIPDGAGIVWAVRWLQCKKINRVAGWDLFVWEMQRLEQRAKNQEQRQENKSEDKAKAFFWEYGGGVGKNKGEGCCGLSAHTSIYLFPTLQAYI
jgi:hypothetical protein